MNRSTLATTLILTSVSLMTLGCCEKEKDRIALLEQENAVLLQAKGELKNVRDGLAKWEYVTLGARGDGIVQITEGVAPGELVIAEGHFALAHDAPVVPIPGETATTD